MHVESKIRKELWSIGKLTLEPGWPCTEYGNHLVFSGRRKKRLETGGAHNAFQTDS